MSEPVAAPTLSNPKTGSLDPCARNALSGSEKLALVGSLEKVSPDPSPVHSVNDPVAILAAEAFDMSPDEPMVRVRRSPKSTEFPVVLIVRYSITLVVGLEP